jgi:hypothetical protein
MLTGSTDCPGGPGRFRGRKYRMYQKTLVRHLNWRNRSIAARKERDDEKTRRAVGVLPHDPSAQPNR